MTAQPDPGPPPISVQRFPASRDQACGSPWDCEGVKAGQRAGYIGAPSDPEHRPFAACADCVDRFEREFGLAPTGTPAAPELTAVENTPAPAPLPTPAAEGTPDPFEMTGAAELVMPPREESDSADLAAWDGPLCGCMSREEGFSRDRETGRWVHNGCGYPALRYADGREQDREQDSPRLDENGRPYDTWRVAGTPTDETYPGVPEGGDAPVDGAAWHTCECSRVTKRAAFGRTPDGRPTHEHCGGLVRERHMHLAQAAFGLTPQPTVVEDEETPADEPADAAVLSGAEHPAGNDAAAAEPAGDPGPERPESSGVTTGGERPSGPSECSAAGGDTGDGLAAGSTACPVGAVEGTGGQPDQAGEGTGGLDQARDDRGGQHGGWNGVHGGAVAQPAPASDLPGALPPGAETRPQGPGNPAPGPGAGVVEAFGVVADGPGRVDAHGSLAAFFAQIGREDETVSMPVVPVQNGFGPALSPADAVRAQLANRPTISPAEFMAATPAATVSGNTPWANRYATELRRVVTTQANRAPRSQQRHLGPSEIGHSCLTGDTEVVTRQGIRRIRDLAKDGSAELLVPLLYEGSDVRKRWGKFSTVPVEQFGEQETYDVTLRRGEDTKVVTATADHHWFRNYWSGKRRKQEKLDTLGLRPGHRLTNLRRARPLTTTLMPVAVSQGFVFGDGTKGSDDDRHRPATLNLFHNGKDEALLPYFPGEHPVYHLPAHAHPHSYVTGLPRFWKHLPPLDESTSFLMSWLAGYFAADGTVSEDGHCTISSAYEAHLRFVQSVAAICGVGYAQVRKYMRRGISGTELAAEETPLYRLTLRVRDLPDWFFLTAQHAERAAVAKLGAERDRGWVVESVEPTGRTEPVYCAVTGEPGAFALADDLMTGNCDRNVVGKLVGLPPTNHVTDPWPSVVGTAIHAWFDKAFADENGRIGRQRWYPERKVTPRFVDHPGTADLYDVDEFSVDDHKCLGETTMAKVRSAAGPPIHYVVQLLTYADGYRRLGARVDRVALLAWPRTGSSLDGLYVWERPHTAADEELLRYTEHQLTYRKQWANELFTGRAGLMDVPADASDENCYFCPFWRPQSAKDGGPGCPGTALLHPQTAPAQPTPVGV